MAKKKTLAIIDGKSVFYRGYYAMQNLATPDGTPTGGVYGFAMMALRVLNDLKPDYVIVAWDKSKTNIRARRKLYEEYKANRKPMPEDLREQIPYLRELLEGFSWPLIELDDYEADDIMATLSREARAKGLKTILVTSDLDILQAVNGDTEVLTLKRGLTDVINYTKEKFRQEYGMTPEQFIDYKALKGDSSDNVPGVAGVGDKTARELIAEYGTLDGVYKNLDNIKESVRKKLEADKDMAYLSHQLLEIKFDAPAELDLDAADVKDAEPAKIDELFRELRFHRLRGQLPDQMKETEATHSSASGQAGNKQQATGSASSKIKIEHIKSEAELKKLKLGKPKQLLIHTMTAEDEPGLPIPQSIMISTDPAKAYVVELGRQLGADKVAGQLRPYLENSQVKKIGYNLKSDYKAWRPSGVRIDSIGFDVMVAAFLLNPLLRSQELADLAENELGIKTHGLAGDELLPLADWASQVGSVLWQLYDHLGGQLADDKKLNSLAQDMEWPIIPILGEMEYIGIQLNTTYLDKMAADLKGRVEKLEKMIHKEAGDEFNINSPQQLQTVLFEKLRLPTKDIKKTKTGYSTAASELAKLRPLHPIIQMLTDYRELTKLVSTYVDTLPKLIDRGGRLHTTFNITVAQTGRLSSDKPNLQNIPIRSEVGKQIRKAFVAGKENTLISADYSQFELRIAAVLSGDNDMIEAFNSGLDVHTQTAAEVYGVAMEDVTKEQRYSAKTINFGVMYGMSPHGLSVATGMDHVEAKKFIDKYFQIREGLLEYLDSLKEKARKDGYVETLFGRKRPMPDIHSSNFVVRASAERAAINMPIQGTEADLMKMAMIEVDKELDGDCQMLLQIHDSILLECPKDKADKTSELVKDTMEHIYDLPVKLDVDVHTGPTWGDLK